MRRPAYSISPINVSSMTRKIDVDNRITLRNYYRIADILLKQANVYREEKNLIDLYVILLRYSSLVSETIPYHKDFHVLYPRERSLYKKKLLAVLDELESLQPKVRRQLDELEKANNTTKTNQIDGPTGISYTSSMNNKASFYYSSKQMLQSITAPSISLKHNNGYNGYTRFSSPTPVESQFQKMSLVLPLPKQETLSKHSLLGPTGLHGQWVGPRPEVKVSYPSNIAVDTNDFSSLNQVGQQEIVATQDSDSAAEKSAMESVLSLDDGRWLAEESGSQGNSDTNDLQLSIIRQPSPPPVLAEVMPERRPVSPSRVADPRPGPPIVSQDGLPSSNSYQDLHIPVKIMDDFLRLAQKNTKKNLETCGILAGSLSNRVFYITTLIIPKQESTSDTCQALNEEEIFEVQDKSSLLPLGWIHTHPTQTCFMSSVDLHTHYSYQVMLPEAVAIVMAPTDRKSPHGIFHLSDPGGVSVIRNCQQRGFHAHGKSEDGSPIYKQCSHVYMNPKLKFDVIDLRSA